MCICVFISWTSFEINGLCPLCNKNWLSYACAHLCRRMCLKCRVHMPLGASFLEDVPLVEFTYLVFTRMPGERYRRRLRSLLFYLCYVFRALINSLVCWSCPWKYGSTWFTCMLACVMSDRSTEARNVNRYSSFIFSRFTASVYNPFACRLDEIVCADKWHTVWLCPTKERLFVLFKPSVCFDLFTVDGRLFRTV